MGAGLIPRQIYLPILMLAVTAFGARASSYDDFNQGIGAHNRGDAAGAIAAFTRALAAGDLAPSLHTVALLDRGFAYLALKQYQTAIADFSEVIVEKPSDSDAYEFRARAYDQIGNFGGALQDCKTVNQLLPKQPQLLAGCGRIAFKAGQFDQASSYFAQVVGLGDDDPSIRYDALWLKLAGLRGGISVDDAFGVVARRADRSKWPGPIFLFFQALETEAVVDNDAANNDPKTQRDQQCEVGFYLGEWKLAHQDKAGAKTLLQQAASLCPSNFIELESAKIDLDKLEKGSS
jgi:tetratricopeptide (TPR) repeat protein